MLSAEIMFRNKGGTAEIIRPLVMKISFFLLVVGFKIAVQMTRER